MAGASSERLIEGATAEARAVAVAGLLAEAGVAQLALARADGWRKLHARETDLPALLLTELDAGRDVELLALDRPLRVTIDRSRAVWIEGEAGGPHESSRDRADSLQ